MDMKKLFEDFKKHVGQLDDDAIKQSISRAVEHSINSSSLECEAEKSDGMYVKSSTQLLQQANLFRTNLKQFHMPNMFEKITRKEKNSGLLSLHMRSNYDDQWHYHHNHQHG